jgi:hypothetical protein
MTDAISRSAVLDQLGEYLVQEIIGQGYDVSDVGVGLEIAISTVKGAPALDVAPVVRCKSRMKRSTFECPMYSEVEKVLKRHGGIIGADMSNDGAGIWREGEPHD